MSRRVIGRQQIYQLIVDIGLRLEIDPPKRSERRDQCQGTKREPKSNASTLRGSLRRFVLSWTIMQQVEGAHFTTVGCPDSIECVATFKNFDWDDKATERRKCISFLLVFVFTVSICLDKLCTLNLPNSELLHTELLENKMTKHLFFCVSISFP